MTARLVGATLAIAWFLSISSTAWAQGHGGGRRSGANGHRRAEPTVVVRTASAVPRSVTVNPSRPFSQPYYAFRLRQHVGFGLYLGFPVAYPSARYYSNAYPYPYAYYPYSPVTQIYTYSATPSYPYAPAVPTYPYTTPVPTYPVYGYSSSGMITIAPGGSSVPAPGGTRPPPVTGGVSFEITPDDAAVFVDGVYVGTASNFSPTAPPLLLAAGQHHFELRAQNHQPMAFDVEVAPGRVVPYRGTLQP